MVVFQQQIFKMQQTKCKCDIFYFIFLSSEFSASLHIFFYQVFVLIQNDSVLFSNRYVTENKPFKTIKEIYFSIVKTINLFVRLNAKYLFSLAAYKFILYYNYIFPNFTYFFII